MHKIKAHIPSLLTIGIFFVFLSVNATSPIPPPKHTFSFAVLADPHVKRQEATWKNDLAEIRDRKAKQERAFTPSELLLVAGDLDPVEKCYDDFTRVFTNKNTCPLFLPVIGNHDCSDAGVHFRYARDVLVPAISNVVCRHPRSCDYYLDYKNMRMIVVDGYTELGINGVINHIGRQWVEQVIKDTPSSIDHIFISFHEPAFPRAGHVGSSFDEDPEQRNAFWRMLLLYKTRVRAVFVGHTHNYSRMRVLDPAGAAANDPGVFPNDDGGIFQVNPGTAGTDSMNTLVYVQIEDKNVFFSVLQMSKEKGQSFEEIDKWELRPSL